MPITASQAVPPWTYTPHARTRAAQRGVTELEIDAVLHRPTITYQQPQHGPDRQMMIGSGLAIAVNTATRTAITVLFQDHRPRPPPAPPHSDPQGRSRCPAPVPDTGAARQTSLPTR